MLSVSAEWKEAIKQQFRYQGYLRATIEVTPPGLHEGMSISSEDTENVANITALENKEARTPTPYVSLESNRWILNGTFKVLQDGEKVDDWWSTPIADTPKFISFKFDQTYNIPGIFFEWDAVNKSFPQGVLVEGYGATDDKLYTYDVTDISSYSGFINVPMDKVQRVDLTIKEWNVSGWRARINEILFGLYASYDSVNNGRIVDAEAYDYSHPLSSELPKHTFTTNLRNLDGEFDPTLQKGISKYLSQRQLIKYQWGFTTSYGTVEWTPVMYYYIEGFSIPEDSKEVELSATSRLAFITNDIKNLEYDATDKTFYDIAELILQKSGVIRENEAVAPWVLSETLKSYKTNAPIPVQAANSLLQLIASASGLWLYTNPTNGYVHITELDDNVVSSVGLAQELGDPTVDVQELLHTVKINVYKYFKGAEKKQVGSGTYTLSGEHTLSITYSCEYATEVTCSVKGATLISFTPYSSSADVQVKVPSGSAEVTVTLNGYEVKSSNTAIETYRDDSITYGLDIEVDNKFITNTDKLQELSDHIVKWYSKAQKLEIPYTGYPELTTGDGIDLTTIYGQHNVQVFGNKITFDGGFNGTLEVR